MQGSLQDKSWEYVIMPWDDETTIIVSENGNSAQTYSRWDLIQKQLNIAKISNVEDLIHVILSYNVVEKNGLQKKPPWKFSALIQYFTQASEIEKCIFFEDFGILSTLRIFALQLKEMLPKLRLLKSGFNSTIKLHQVQIASILSCAFFCIFPKRNANCPSINFNTLYEGHADSVPNNYVEKIKCLMHYFFRMHERRKKSYKPTGNVSFHRQFIPDHKFPRWDKATASLCRLVVNEEGNIEDQHTFLQVDFANKYIGGGVLGRGCVQEEIRFLISPELIAGRLFSERLGDNESILVVGMSSGPRQYIFPNIFEKPSVNFLPTVTKEIPYFLKTYLGAERFSTYSGYSNTFTFTGNYEDKSPFDEKRHRRNYLIIIDALFFQISSEQYRESKILREIKKAYVGFKSRDEIKGLPLATGNWGCGAFGGDPQLKTIIQLLASSQADRHILYLTFGDSLLRCEIEQFYYFLNEKSVDVGTLYRIVRLYNRQKDKDQRVFDYVKAEILKLEKKKYSQISAPSPSADASPDFELSTLTQVLSNKRKADILEKETDDCFLELNFEALDKEIQEKSKELATNRLFRSSQEESKVQENLCSSDILGSESEHGCSTSAIRQWPEQSRKLERRPVTESSPSLLNKEIQESKDFGISRQSARSKPNKEQNSKPPQENFSILDVLYYESEHGCTTSSIGQWEEKPRDRERPGVRENSPSLFRGDEMEIVQEDSEKNLSSNVKGNPGKCHSETTPPTTSNTKNKRGNETLHKTDTYKKIIQPKITDCFFKK